MFGTPIKYEEFANLEKDKKIPSILKRIETSMKNLEKWAEGGFKGPIP